MTYRSHCDGRQVARRRRIAKVIGRVNRWLAQASFDAGISEISVVEHPNVPSEIAFLSVAERNEALAVISTEIQETIQQIQAAHARLGPRTP